MAPNPLDYITIQNTLSRYCIALDTKDFNLLKQVFTEDCDTVYPFGGQIKGVQKVADAIQNRYAIALSGSAWNRRLIHLAALSPSPLSMH